MNEISQILELGEQRIATLKKLRSEWQALQEPSLPAEFSSEDDLELDLKQDFEDAMALVTQNIKQLPRLLVTLKNSLDVVSTASCGHHAND